MQSGEEGLRPIQKLVVEHRARVAAADLAELQLARAIQEHLEQSPSQAGELAERLDLGESTVAQLRALSRGRLTGLNLDGTVPSITHHRIREMMKQHGPVSRVIGHVNSGLVLHESGLGLQPFRRQGRHSGPYLRCENMLIRFGDAAWAQVEDVLFGYGGTGPSNAYRALQLAGLSEEDSDAVFRREGVNYLVDADGSVQEKDFEEAPPSMPKLMPDGSLVAVIDGDRHDDSGEMWLRAWIDYLDRHDVTALWEDGPRRISLYPARADAEADGFFEPYKGVAQLIIEQGGLQLWLVERVKKDPSVCVPRKFRRYLEILGVLHEVQDVITMDDASPFQRWRASHAYRRPPAIGLGAGPITRFPNLIEDLAEEEK